MINRRMFRESIRGLDRRHVGHAECRIGMESGDESVGEVVDQMHVGEFSVERRAVDISRRGQA